VGKKGIVGEEESARSGDHRPSGRFTAQSVYTGTASAQPPTRFGRILINPSTPRFSHLKNGCSDASACSWGQRPQDVTARCTARHDATRGRKRRRSIPVACSGSSTR
jgi:hypothetical protein